MKELQILLQRAEAQWGRDTVAAIIRQMRTYPIRWQGTLQRSIVFKQKDLELDFFMADYGKFIDEGIGIFGPSRKPPGPRFKGALAHYLKPWADSKGLNSWAVATNIVKRGGIRPRPFFKSVIEQRIPMLDTYLDNAYTEYLNTMVENANQ